MPVRYYDKVPFAVFDWLAKFWPIIVSILFLSVSYGYKNMELNALEISAQKSVEIHNILIESNRVRDQRITRLETAIEILPEMRQDIKTLLKRSN